MTPSRYRIVVRGRLSERFAAALNGVSIEPLAGQTALQGEFVDETRSMGSLTACATSASSS